MHNNGDNKYISYVAVVLLAILISGCAEKDIAAETVSSGESFADEIAEGISENVVPHEAYEYSRLSFDIPENMQTCSDNTVDEGYYFANDSEDYSYIYYSRSLRNESEESVSGNTLFSKDVFAERLSRELSTDVEIVSYDTDSEEHYDLYITEAAFCHSDVDYTMKEYIFVTDGYIFCLDYCLGGNMGMSEKFADSQSTVCLESVADSVSVNQ